MTSFAYIFPFPFTLLHLLPTLQPIGRIFAMCNVTLYNYVITPVRLLQRDDAKKLKF